MDIVSTVAPGEARAADDVPAVADSEPDGRLGQESRGSDTRSVERLSVAWSEMARWIWAGLIVVVVVRVVVTIRIYFLEVHTPCTGEICQGPPSMTSRQMELLHAAGFSAEAYAACCAVLLVGSIAINCGIAGVIIWRRPADGMAVLTAFTLTLFGGLSLGLPDQLFHQWEPFWWLPMAVFAWLGTVAIMVFFYLFPGGRPVLRWPAIPVVVWTVAQMPTYVAPAFALTVNRLAGPFAAPMAAAISLATFGSLIYAQIYRYRRVSTPLQREQTKWVVYGIAIAIVGWVVLLAFWQISNVNASNHNPLLDLVTVAVGYLLWLLIPLSLGVAILRYRLWDIDILINRTLLYGSLTAMVAGVYILTVGYLGSLFRSPHNLLISLLATGVVAVLFQPAREWLQHLVNRLMYGERDEPYAVLARLGQRLESTLAPSAVLPVIVETITEALKLPYAAIELGAEKGATVAAEIGQPVPNPHRFALMYQQEEVGRLVVGVRTGDEGFNASDRLLLNDLARQAGVAVHALQLHAQALQLASDLQRARERLVTTREEERRRLRRDLHDGIGPTLASLTHRLDLAGDLVMTEPMGAISALAELKGQVKDAVKDIRRLVYDLRPPALDDFGLLPAIREHVARQTEASGLRVTVEAPDHLPPLPAAIEVAVYRIVLEAVTNVVCHAEARTCRVRLWIGDWLYLTIEDDGHGLSPNYVPGVGLASMRERATELGGSCAVERGTGGGTAVCVQLPLAWE
jgi:signal transduction histidine kinase